MQWGSGQPSRQPQQGSGGRSVWGSGASNNRFAPLSNDGGRNNRSAGGRVQSGQTNWRDVARHDLVTEPIPWPASCYSSTREGPNDLTGDVCPEEARWAAMSAARAGASGAQLASAFTAARQLQQQQTQALLNAQQAPSLNGAPAIGADSSPLLRISSEQQVPATPAGQTFPVFGQQQANNAPAGGFGSGFGNTSFGAGNTTKSVFGSGASGDAGQNSFSNTPSPTPAGNRMVFGSAVQQSTPSPSTPFGANTPAQSPFPGGSSPFTGSASPTPQFAANPSSFNTSSNATLPAFGSSDIAASTPLPAFGASTAGVAAFGNSNATSATSGGTFSGGAEFGSATGGTAFSQPAADNATSFGGVSQNGMANGHGNESDNPWTAASFEVGKIPEDPPPAIYCH